MSGMTRIVERDSTGREIKSYILSTEEKPTEQSRPVTRLDPVALELESDSVSFSTNHYATSVLRLPLAFLSDHLLPLFLPHGYPHTVTPDYTSYQIYDSLQAFASTIAGLLSSRAVLQSLGFDDGRTSSTSTATFATLLSIAQATVSNLSTILFAHYASQRINSDVKFYRFLADIVNDTAFVIDCLSPSLPRNLRVAALCLSSVCRAVCGVAGGSSKAVLSSHFAINGNVGELNAKDGSQETVIGLVGMWVGGIVVSRVSGAWATWSWMLGLLALHLWFNYRAVRCIRLRGLNGYRTGKILGELHDSGKCPSIDEIGRNEGIFCRSDTLIGRGNTRLGRVRTGISINQFMAGLGGSKQPGSGAWVAKHDNLQRCMQILRERKYLLWYNVEWKEAHILLKDQATIEDQLQAWYHAICMAIMVDGGSHDASDNIVEVLSRTLAQTKADWPDIEGKIIAAGWDLSRSGTETRLGIRVSIL